MRNKRALCLVGLRLILGWLLGASLAFRAAAQGYWDINGSAAGASSGNTAAGTWGAGNFWNSNANGTGATTAWQSGQRAVFSAGTNATGNYTVTVSGNQIVSGILFEDGSVTLTGGTLTLQNGTGGATVSVNTNRVGRIGSQIAGVDGLIKTGSGTLVLSGNNTYSGVTDLREGTLDVENFHALGNSLLNFDGGDIAVGPAAAAIPNDITISANSTITGSGPITFSGNVQNQGGNWTLTVNNPGQTTFSGSTFTLAEKSEQRQLTFDVQSGNVTISGTVQNGPTGRPDGITKLGDGALTLTGNNTFSGPLNIFNGALVLGQDTSAGLGTLTLASGTTISATNGPRIISNPLILGTNITFGGTDSLTFLSSLTMNGNVTLWVENTTTLSGKITGTGSLFKEGDGKLVLSGNNTSWGSSGGDVISVNDGVLAIGNNRALGKAGNTLALNGGSVEASGGALIEDHAVVITRNSGIGGNNNLTFTGPVSNLGGSHTLTVSNTALTTFSGATLTLSGPNQSAALTLDVTDTSGGLTVSAPIQNGSGTGIGTLVKNGGGDLLLSGTAPNTFSGGFTINDGTVTAGKINALGTGALNINAGTLDIGSYNQTVGALSMVSGTIDGTTGRLTPTSMQVQSGTINATLAGTATLVKTTPGVLTLSAANQYTGGTAINGGTVIVQNSTGSATGTGSVTVNNGGTLAGSGIIAGQVTLNNGATLAPGSDNGIGTLRTGSEVWNGGSTITLDVENANTGAGVGWDFLNIAGTLSLNASSNNPISLDLESLTLAGDPGPVANFTNGLSYTWRIITASGGFSLTPGQTLDSIFHVSLNGFANDVGQGYFTFSLGNGGHDVVLTFNPAPIPEPSAACMAAIGFLLLAARFRVRRRPNRTYRGTFRGLSGRPSLTKPARPTAAPDLTSAEIVGS